MSDIPTKEIGELLDVVSSKLPNLIKEIHGTIFSEEGASQLGKAVAAFYKNLLEAGMSQEDAVKLTRDYMQTLSTITNQLKG